MSLNCLNLLAHPGVAFQYLSLSSSVNCYNVLICLQVYFCIAILRHLQQDILRKTQQQQLLIFLKVSCVCVVDQCLVQFSESSCF